MKSTERYSVRDSESGNVIDDFSSYQLAEEEIERFEVEDKKNGIYTEFSYEIYDNVLNKVI